MIALHVFLKQFLRTIRQLRDSRVLIVWAFVALDNLKERAVYRFSRRAR